MVVSPRELVPWEDSGGGVPVDLSESAASGPWDQFAVNEKLGVKTLYVSADVYSTPLDRSSEWYKQNEAEAARIAEEIVGDKSGNVHQAEERGQSPVGGDVDMTEEDRYAAVDRHGRSGGEEGVLSDPAIVTLGQRAAGGAGGAGAGAAGGGLKAGGGGTGAEVEVAQGPAAGAAPRAGGPRHTPVPLPLAPAPAAPATPTAGMPQSPPRQRRAARREGAKPPPREARLAAHTAAAAHRTRHAHALRGGAGAGFAYVPAPGISVEVARASGKNRHGVTLPHPPGGGGSASRYVSVVARAPVLWPLPSGAGVVEFSRKAARAARDARVARGRPEVSLTATVAAGQRHVHVSSPAGGRPPSPRDGPRGRGAGGLLVVHADAGGRKVVDPNARGGALRALGVLRALGARGGAVKKPRQATPYTAMARRGGPKGGEGTGPPQFLTKGIDGTVLLLKSSRSRARSRR